MATEANAMKRKTREEIALAYKSPPVWYDIRGFFILTFAYNSTLWAQVRFFGRNMGPRHIEIACGTATLTWLVMLWRRWHKMPAVHVTGIDYAESMLAGAIQRFKDWPNTEFLHADAAALPFDDESFDTANIANSVHCFPDVLGALKDAKRVLKPGGTLACNVLLYPRGVWPFRQIAQAINDWGIRKGILYTPFEREQFRDLLAQAGFEVLGETVTGNCFEALVRKPPAVA